jgi:hypothetical protein
MNLPTHCQNSQALVLSSLPTTPVADGNDRLTFNFTGQLPTDIDPGIPYQTGWKVLIPSASIKYCTTCYDCCGLVPIIYLRGDLVEVEFFFDPSDTLEIYIRHLGS